MAAAKSESKDIFLKGLIGFYGGSFNPFHNGHFQAINYLLDHTNIDKVILTPSFLPPHKQGQEMPSFEHRFKMTELGSGELLRNEKVILSDIEKTLPQPSYTYQTLKKLQAKYSQPIAVILGDDMSGDISSWYRANELLEEFSLIILKRVEKENLDIPRHFSKDFSKNRFFLKNPLWKYSSTSIRKKLEEYRIKQDKQLLIELESMFPKEILNYIFTHKLYF